MARTSTILAIILMIGLAAAETPPIDPFLQKYMDKLYCAINFAYDLAEYADLYTEDAMPLYEDMKTSVGNMEDYAADGDRIAFFTEYRNFILQLNSLMSTYFYYGILEGGEGFLGHFIQHKGDFMTCLASPRT